MGSWPRVAVAQEPAKDSERSVSGDAALGSQGSAGENGRWLDGEQRWFVDG